MSVASPATLILDAKFLLSCSKDPLQAGQEVVDQHSV